MKWVWYDPYDDVLKVTDFHCFSQPGVCAEIFNGFIFIGEL